MICCRLQIDVLCYSLIFAMQYSTVEADLSEDNKTRIAHVKKLPTFRWFRLISI